MRGSLPMPRPLPLRRLLAVALIAATAAPLKAADATTYFPDGTMLVVSFNVKQFLQAPLVRDSGKSMIADMSKAFEAFGVDAANDLDRVVLAVGEQLRSASTLVLLHGRFDADKVQERLKTRAQVRKGDIELIDEGGTTVFQCRL